MIGLNPPCASADDDWNRFRGPNGSGIALALSLPNDFTLEQNTLWNIEAGAGNSSVVTSEKFLFVTSKKVKNVPWLSTISNG